MNENPLKNLTSFLNRLREAKIYYGLEHDSDEGVMVLVTVPGQRWEVEFFWDGRIEVERFISTGEIEHAKALDELFEKFSD